MTTIKIDLTTQTRKNVMKIKLSILTIVALTLAACETLPPSTTYLDGSKGKGLPANMSPAQRLGFVNPQMTKQEVIDVIGFPHASGSYPPNLECMSWIYRDPKYPSINMTTNAIAVFKNGKLIFTNPSEHSGCDIQPSKYKEILNSAGN